MEKAEEQLASLEEQIAGVKERIDRFGRTPLSGAREKALIYCLRRVAEVGEGCLILAKASLASPMFVLTRALFETLLWSFWVSLSEENGRNFTQGAANELTRVAQKNLRAGTAKIEDKTTGDDKTAEFLDRPEMINIPKRLRFEKIAKESGVERLYNVVYGFLSMMAHGNTFGLTSKSTAKQQTSIALASVEAILQAINTIVDNWFLFGRITPHDEVFRILGICELVT